MGKSNYGKTPYVAVTGRADCCVAGWDTIAARLRESVSRRATARTLVAVECYAGVHEVEILNELKVRLSPRLALAASQALRAPEEVERLVAPFLGGDDPVFGFLTDLSL